MLYCLPRITAAYNGVIPSFTSSAAPTPSTPADTPDPDATTTPADGEPDPGATTPADTTPPDAPAPVGGGLEIIGNPVKVSNPADFQNNDGNYLYEVVIKNTGSSGMSLSGKTITIAVSGYDQSKSIDTFVNSNQSDPGIYTISSSASGSTVTVNIGSGKELAPNESITVRVAIYYSDWTTLPAGAVLTATLS